MPLTPKSQILTILRAHSLARYLLRFKAGEFQTDAVQQMEVLVLSLMALRSAIYSVIFLQAKNLNMI